MLVGLDDLNQSNCEQIGNSAFAEFFVISLEFYLLAKNVIIDCFLILSNWKLIKSRDRLLNGYKQKWLKNIRLRLWRWVHSVYMSESMTTARTAFSIDYSVINMLIWCKCNKWSLIVFTISLNTCAYDSANTYLRNVWYLVHYMRWNCMCVCVCMENRHDENSTFLGSDSNCNWHNFHWFIAQTNTIVHCLVITLIKYKLPSTIVPWFDFNKIRQNGGALCWNWNSLTSFVIS